jgi:putative transposase
LINQAPTVDVPAAGRQFGKPIAGSLGTIVGVYKAAVTRRVNKLSNAPTGSFWQRNFHEHIIRNEQSLTTIRQYVENNPASWKQDKFFSTGRWDHIP